MVQKRLNKLYEKADFDIQNYKELERDIEKIRDLIAECV